MTFCQSSVDQELHVTGRLLGEKQPIEAQVGRVCNLTASAKGAHCVQALTADVERLWQLGWGRYGTVRGGGVDNVSGDREPTNERGGCRCGINAREDGSNVAVVVAGNTSELPNVSADRTRCRCYVS